MVLVILPKCLNDSYNFFFFLTANVMKVINSLSMLGYKVVCSNGDDSHIVWTLSRETLVCIIFAFINQSEVQ